MDINKLIQAIVIVILGLVTIVSLMGAMFLMTIYAPWMYGVLVFVLVVFSVYNLLGDIEKE